MDRKHFIRSTASLLAATTVSALPVIAAAANDPDGEDSPVMLPASLKKGDTIGITAPAGYITQEEIQSAVLKMKDWGYQVKIGDTIGKKDFTFGGTDDEREKDFQQMLNDPAVKAIMCARGGYGSVRIIDRFNWTRFRAKPKWIVGFSDITVLHSHINRHFHIATVHSKMCNSFPDDWSKAEPVQIDSIDSIRKILSGEKIVYSIVPNSNNRSGIAEGILVGGNLKTLETLSASASDIITDGKILFVEDTGEYMYSIDRMFWNLKRSGKLSKLKGLVVGGFKAKVDADTEDFGKTLEQVVLEKVKDFNYPVCFDFPVGHQKNNFALKCGTRHKLMLTASTTSLTGLQ